MFGSWQMRWNDGNLKLGNQNSVKLRRNLRVRFRYLSPTQLSVLSKPRKPHNFANPQVLILMKTQN
jgi:hypothetical protein